MEKEKFPKAFETSVNICFVSDERYADPLCTSLYSLLWNRDKTRFYDILILQDDISEKAAEQIRRWRTKRKESASAL